MTAVGTGVTLGLRVASVRQADLKSGLQGGAAGEPTDGSCGWRSWWPCWESVTRPRASTVSADLQKSE